MHKIKCTKQLLHHQFKHISTFHIPCPVIVDVVVNLLYAEYSMLVGDT